jgi:predicted PurR-regulated permease PerM
LKSVFVKTPVIKDRAAYKTLVSALKKQNRGITVADMAAKTALSLQSIRDLIPQAADEYNARLEVSESGEILYSFPRGFKSRYRGFGPAFSRFAEKAVSAVKSFLQTAFKVWIMVMLVGYFVLFILIALAAVLFVTAASASNKQRDRRSSGGLGNAYVLSRLMNIVFRFWFYSSLMNTRYSGAYSRKRADNDERPLYKKVFSFVFGDGDPNGNWAEKEVMGVIDYLRKKNGVFSLPEFMILTGLDVQAAEREILSCCAKYGGMPEATEDGTVVYRFDSLLLSAEKASSARNVVSLKNPWKFSANKDGTNTAFVLINFINLGFGGYFLYFFLNPAALSSSFSYLFRFVYSFLVTAGVSPLLPIVVGLGIVPVLFSLFFWIVPALRKTLIKKKNAAINLENRRKQGFAAIWGSPMEVTEDMFNDAGEADRLIKEIGSYSVPDVFIDNRGKTVYSFKELNEEKKALEKYRSQADKNRGDLGGIVFDSD